jgi:hypothetical protein
MSASLREREPNSVAARSVPAAIVNGRPIPSKRTGIDISRRSPRRSMREESENRTTASVASASVRTVALVGPTVMSSSTSGPARTPIATITIAGVTGVADSRREIPATKSSARPTVASCQPMRYLDLPNAFARLETVTGRADVWQSGTFAPPATGCSPR